LDTSKYSFNAATTATDPDINEKLNEIHSDIQEQKNTTSDLLSALYFNLDRKIDVLANDVNSLRNTTTTTNHLIEQLQKSLNTLMMRPEHNEIKSSDLLDKMNTRFYWGITITFSLFGLALALIKLSHSY
jgi:chromosome segregation ATPase